MKTKPVRKAMFMPEIARRWARLLSRSACTVSWRIAERSPVIAAAAKAPASPGIAAIIAADNCRRSRLIASAPGAGICQSITGLRE